MLFAKKSIVDLENPPPHAKEMERGGVEFIIFAARAVGSA